MLFLTSDRMKLEQLKLYKVKDKNADVVNLLSTTKINPYFLVVYFFFFVEYQHKVRTNKGIHTAHKINTKKKATHLSSFC